MLFKLTAPPQFGLVHFQYRRVVWLVLLVVCFVFVNTCNYLSNAYSVDPDQAPLSATSDPGQHCLPMSILYQV